MGLVGLKRLMEVVADDGGTLAINRSGHPKLRNDLRRPRPLCPRRRHRGPTSLRHLTHRRVQSQGRRSRLPIDDAAIALLAAAAAHPPQIEQHLTLAFEHGFRCGEKPVTAEVLETVLSRQLDDLEPRLTRHAIASRTWLTSSMRSPPRSGCSCAALRMPNARASYPSRCASPACRCESADGVTNREYA
jgi:hypothetical protein